VAAFQKWLHFKNREINSHVPHLPHGGVRPFHQKSTCLTQLTLGPYVVHNWSRDTPESGVNETLLLHRVKTGYEISNRKWLHFIYREINSQVDHLPPRYPTACVQSGLKSTSRSKVDNISVGYQTLPWRVF